MVGRLITAWQLVAKQSLAHWRLTLSVVVGVVLATTIMAGTVIYFDSLRDLALENILGKRSDLELDILVKTERGPISRREYDRIAAVANREIDRRVAWMVTDRFRVGKTQTFFLTRPGEEEHAGEDNARSYFAFVPGLQQHTRLLPGGRFPTETRMSESGDVLEIEAVIPAEAAELFGVGVGDRLVTVPPRTEDFENVRVVISGVFERTDPGHELWYLEKAVLNAPTGPSFRTVPFHVSEKTFMEVLGPSLRKMDGTYAWLLVVDRGRLNSGNADAALADISAMDLILTATLSRYRQITELDEALSEYRRRLFFSKLPMFVVFSLISVVILYYVVTLSNLAVEDRSTEMSLLRSRGASSAQVLAVFAIEGTTIAVVAIVVGPILAAAVVSVLGFTPAFSDLTGSASLPATLSSEAFMLSSLGGLLALAALMVPAVQASRIGVTRQRQQAARPASLPTFQRYYLDVMLLLVGILLLYQLNRQGSVVARNLLGEVEADQLFIVLPGLIMVAAAVVVLRLFPLAMKLGSRVLSPWLPAGLALGVWQMARSPAHYARLSLLLVLTAGLGIFASSFDATLDRSFRERILFSTGSDIRLDGVRQAERVRRSTPTTARVRRPRPPLVESYEQVPGVERASPVFRGDGRDLTEAIGESFVLVAMDSESFGEVAWFRDDFADESMDGLLRSLKVELPPQGIELPQDATLLTVTVKADRRHPSVRVTARVKNGHDQYFTYDLGKLDTAEWAVKETSIGSPDLSAGPLVLVSLRVDETIRTRRLEAGSMLIDDISVRRRGGDTEVIEAFDNVDGWAVLRGTPDSKSDGLLDSASGSNGDSRSALFSWTTGMARAARGIFHGTPPGPLPVLASRSFAEATGHSRGETFEVSVLGHRLLVQVNDTIDMFPTFTKPNERFLVADLSSVSRYANLSPLNRELLPNELWISTSAPVDDRDRLVGRLSGVNGYRYDSAHNRAERLAGSKVDPLVEAGWRALLFIAFSAVLLLSSVGFLIHAYVSFRSRRLEYALLRTVGTSMRQLMTMIWLEQTLIIVVGLGLGTLLGGMLGNVIMPFLAHNDFGGQVMPPYMMEVSWQVLLTSYAAMLAIFAIIIMGLVWIVHRTSLQRMLRLGEV